MKTSNLQAIFCTKRTTPHGCTLRIILIKSLQISLDMNKSNKLLPNDNKIKVNNPSL